LELRILLDTHILLSAGGASNKLPERVRGYLLDAGNRLHISSISAWEIFSKNRLGKLDLPLEPLHWLEQISSDLGAVHLPFEANHANAVGNIEDYHKDPFDRMLICQAMVEGLTILTKDEAIRKYNVSTLW
jgi:PIN domain nuclease of toxin-antitoxin system